MCTYESTSKCIDVANICDLVPDGTQFKDETDCSKYYKCNQGKHESKTCSNGYFDLAKNSCADKSLVKCTAHPLYKNVCIKSNKPSPGKKPDQATCRGYFLCADLGVGK